MEANGDFCSSALRLSGLAGALLGWRPGEFWSATPAELAAVFGAMRPEREAVAGADELARLKELFPDG
ncbi:MAG TPA: phage tail assembly chaperone [Sphingomonas sp.]|nr:phage tail assembly chaperone [Sphingomonas sp.]